MTTTTVKTFNNTLHHYPNFTKNEVVKFLTGKGMTEISAPNELTNNNQFKIV